MRQVKGMGSLKHSKKKTKIVGTLESGKIRNTKKTEGGPRG